MSDQLRVPPGVFEDAQGAFRRVHGAYSGLASELRAAAGGLGDACGEEKVAGQFRDAFRQLSDGLEAAAEACASMATDVLERLRHDFEAIDHSQRIPTEPPHG